MALARLVASETIKIVALLVFLAGVGAATYGVQVVVGDGVTSKLYDAAPVREHLNVTPGHTAGFAITVHNRDVSAKDLRVEVSGPGVTARSDPQTVRAAGNATFFVAVPVPAGAAPGELDLDVQILDGAAPLRTEEGALSLTILPRGEGLAPGDAAVVMYTGRIATTGRVFNTNDPALVGLNFPRTDSYRFSAGLFTVETAPRPTVVEGFYEGLLGMQPGESRTVTFPPEKGYGPGVTRETIDREESLDRTFALKNTAESVARDVFDDYIASTKQTKAEPWAAGDVFRFTQAGNSWPYRITALTATQVSYELAAQLGEKYTIFPFWTNASEIVGINETHVSFYTTPTTAIGAPITMKAYWPEMSSVVELTEDTIVVRHSPPQGFRYTMPAGMGQPRESTVAEVTATSIVVATPATHPLAGQDLTFDITLVELER